MIMKIKFLRSTLGKTEEDVEEEEYETVESSTIIRVECKCWPQLNKLKKQVRI